jgi:tetratricopeptide (TPR) repeat protein
MNFFLPLVLIVSGVIGHTLSDDESRYDTYRRAGLTAFWQLNYKDAENDFKDALAEARIFGPSDTRLATALANLAILYAKTRRFHEAEELLQQSVAILKTNDPNHDLSLMLNSLAEVYLMEGRLKDTERTLAIALSLARSGRGATDATVANILDNRGLLQLKEKKYRQAEDSYQQSLTIREKTQAADDFNFASALNGLGTLYVMRRRFSKAEELLERSLKIAEANLPPYHPELAVILENLALVENKLHHFESSKTYFRRGIAIQTAELAMSRPELIAAYADTLRNLNRLDEAAVLLERRKRLLDEQRFTIKANRP